MKWLICFFLSSAILLLFILLALIRAKSKYVSGRILTPSKIFFAGVAISSIILFIPIYITHFSGEAQGPFEVFLTAVHNTIRLFVVDGDFTFITDNIAELSGSWLSTAYSTFFAILFVLAPLLTFGFVLSFFKNLMATVKYRFHLGNEVCIFSELNDKSIALAQSVLSRNKRALIVFTDVFVVEEERIFELHEKAKELRAICFKKDIVAVNFLAGSRGRTLSFFTIGEDENENISQTLKLIEAYKYRDKTNLYVFSTQDETEMLLANAFDSSEVKSNKKLRIKVRRINEVRSLVSRTLYDMGYEIFKNANHIENGDKKISALVVGMGNHGTEMTKALSWLCQMDGYLLDVNCYDMSLGAEDAFTAICPELMSKERNGVIVDGESKGKITIHSGVNVNSYAFIKGLDEVSDATYIFVALGNDELNISTAVKLRAYFESLETRPIIQAVVYNSDKKEAMSDITNFKGQRYDIDFIGDIRSSFCEKIMLGSEVERIALERHLNWGSEDDFWKYGYNYNSSVASAIHRKMKILCGIPGTIKLPEDRNEEELWAIRKLEHCRWNAYMRSEGYTYGPKRNDLAKKHHCLVPFDQLSYEDQIKDDD